MVKMYATICIRCRVAVYFVACGTRSAAPAGMSPARLRLLGALYSEGPQIMHDLSEWLGVKKTTMDQSPPSSPDGWYNKYGVYNLGGSEAQSEWKNVRYYRK